MGTFFRNDRFTSQANAVPLTEHRYVARNPNNVPIIPDFKYLSKLSPFKWLLCLFLVRFLTSQIALNKLPTTQQGLDNKNFSFYRHFFVMMRKGVPFKTDNECDSVCPMSLNCRVKCLSTTNKTCSTHQIIIILTLKH